MNTVEISTYKVSSEGAVEFSDVVACEEPLEIRLGQKNTPGKSVAITMRTPGEDTDLAIGFLFTEGIIHSPTDIDKVAHCPLMSHKNIINVEVVPDIVLPWKQLERHSYVTSSCGICGKASIANIVTKNRYQKEIAKASGGISPAIVQKLPDILREKQKNFAQTGGIHASGLFTLEGQFLDVREDVGRHNALDKLIGSYFLQKQIPLVNSILVLSGRASFELIQKASMAGISIVASVGAPSSLAVDLAKEMKITLLGFVRSNRFNVYCGQERILV